jgi:hypothetical protein
MTTSSSNSANSSFSGSNTYGSIGIDLDGSYDAIEEHEIDAFANTIEGCRRRTYYALIVLTLVVILFGFRGFSTDSALRIPGVRDASLRSF